MKEYSLGEIKMWIIKRCNSRLHVSRTGAAKKNKYTKAEIIKAQLNTICSLRTECEFLIKNHQSILDIIIGNRSGASLKSELNKMLEFSKIYMVRNPKKVIYYD